MTDAAPRSAERVINTERVLGALGLRDALTQAELKEATGLSRPTLTAILGELGDSGWVRSRPRQADRHGAGRPARAFGVDADVLRVAGVDVGVYTARVAVADVTGAVQASADISFAPETAGARRLAMVQDLIGETAAQAGVEVSGLAALCVGVPGIVDATGRIRRSTVVPDWSGLHVGEVLEEWSGRAVDVVNDANLAAVGEHWAGAAREADDVVYLHVGRRTSAGLLIGGRVHSGRTGAAGEIGAIPALYVDNTRVLLGGAGEDHARIPDVFADAAAGRRPAADRVEDFAHRLAGSVETLIHVIDPDVVVLGGGVSRAGEALLEAVRRHVPVVNDLMPPLALGELADSAVTLGGVRRAQLLASRSAPHLRVLLDAKTAVPERRTP